MSSSGWQLAADLTDLKVVATVDLPALAYTFARLNNVVGDTTFHDDQAFGGWGPADPVYPVWSALRDGLQDILADTSSVLTTTGQVLAHIVDTYAATDHEAAAALNSAWHNGPPNLDPAEQAPPGPPPAVRYS